LNVRDDDGNSPAIPSSKNIITISREGSQYRVDYLTGSGKSKYKLVPELPPDMGRRTSDNRNGGMTLKIQIWLEPVTMSMYQISEKEWRAQKTTQNLRDKLPREVISNIKLRPK
jgi:hypothetical protein